MTLASLLAGVLITLPSAAVAPSTTPAVSVWETSGDQTQLLAPQPGTSFAAGAGAATAGESCSLLGCSPIPTVNISVDDTQHFQQMDGFGATMTDSSAYVLEHDMSASQRASVMNELFSTASGTGLDYLRVPIGANDFSTSNYTEDDMPPGQTDPTLAHFAITHDLVNLVPALKQALAIDPQIKLLASPWSAPAWMKTSGTLDGGSLKPADYSVYAQYLVKFIQAYAAQGLPITAITMQNEPDDPETSYPGMTLTAAQETAIAPLLHQDLATAHLSTEILGLDSDWSDEAYAASLLGSSAGSDLAGTAFHCYVGDPSAQLALEQAYPNDGIWETECSATDAYTSFDGNLVNGTNNLIINGVRDYAKTVMLWNLVLDQHDGPTNGGCLNCTPDVTVNSTTGNATYNVETYMLGQVSKFVAPGATRIASTDPGQGSVETVAFQDPNGEDVLVALNTASSSQVMNVQWDGSAFQYTIPAGAVQTFTWAG